MAEYSLTYLAERDLDDMAAFTDEHWGRHQAELYIIELRSMCGQLATRPKMGRSCAEIRPRLHRMECGSHIIFYRKSGSGIVVLRFLHKRMLATAVRMTKM